MIGRMLDRYILKQMIPFYFLGVAAFALFFITADAFERIDVFVDNHTPVALIIRYYAAGSVYNAILVSPIALLLAIFFVFGQMTRFNEVTAMKTAGLSLYRIFVPVWLLALLISGGCWWVADSLMPRANQQKKEIYNEKIRGRPPRTGGVRMNLNYLGPAGRIWAVRRYH
ncbi:MAG TPA: LptF/LptG family permease, partial [Candidatus Eisenbacteria bacterium]